jgi:hypothetical protein
MDMEVIDMDRLEEVTLREHFENHCSERTARQDRDIASLKELVCIMFAALDKRLETEGAALDKRLETLNNFRDAMRDIQAGAFTRAEHEQYQERVEVDLRILRQGRSELEGRRAEIASKASQSQFLVVLAVSILSVLVSLFTAIKH